MVIEINEPGKPLAIFVNRQYYIVHPSRFVHTRDLPAFVACWIAMAEDTNHCLEKINQDVVAINLMRINVMAPDYKNEIARVV